MEEQVATLAELFRQGCRDYHQITITTNGKDHDWVLRCANYLVDKLPAYLGIALTRIDIIYALIQLDKDLKAEAADADWAKYYARKLLARYS